MEKSKVIQKNVSYLDRLFESLDQNLNDQDDFQNLIPAAVLILIYEKNSEIYVILTKRSMDLKIHKGEFCFPGGTQEATDQNLCTAAIREAKEEVGIDFADMDILGRIPGYAATSNHYIVGFVGKVQDGYEYELNRKEVNSIMQIPLKSLMSLSSHRYEYILDKNDKIKKMCCYGFRGNYIFGATALLLSNFLKIVRIIEEKDFE
tara:strand:+ start:40 stop:654 length:615 start_codon:yes stop_codon:yes gene_type:complete